MCGKTGDGKSKCATEVAERATDNAWSCYAKNACTKCFDGYCQDELIICDELTAEF